MIAVPALLQHPKIQALIPLWNKAPFTTRLVGGAIRDTLLSRELHDFDFAAACDFQTLEGFLKHQKIPIIRNSPQHGSLSFLYNRHPYDITILRKDLKGNGRHADITTTHDWVEDAQRRDFSINALSMDWQGKIHDPLGIGLTDLKQGMLRFIGNPEQRIQEDYLRILRYFRFLGQLQFSSIKSQEAFIFKHREGLTQLSRERIRAEIFPILCLENPMVILEKMQSLLLWDSLISGVKPQDWGYLPQCQKQDPIFRLCAWWCRTQAQVDFKELAQDWVLSRQEQKTIKSRLTPPEKPFHARLWLYRYGEQLSLDYLELYTANDNTHREQLINTDKPIFPLTGAMLYQHGLRGKTIRDTQKKAEDYWIETEFTATQSELIAHVIRLKDI